MLSDSEKKARYDQFGHAGVDPNFGAGGPGGSPFGQDIDLGDIFNSVFGGFGGFGGGGRRANPNAPRRGTDVETSVYVSFEEAAKGAKKRFSTRLSQLVLNVTVQVPQRVLAQRLVHLVTVQVE